MAGLGRGDCENTPAQPCFGKPARHRAFQDTRPVRAQTASGNHQDTTLAGDPTTLDKIHERTMRFGLRQPMQIEPRLDRVSTALQAFGIGPIDASKRRNRPGIGCRLGACWRW